MMNAPRPPSVTQQLRTLALLGFLTLSNPLSAGTILQYDFEGSSTGTTSLLEDQSGNGLHAESAGPSTLLIDQDGSDPVNSSKVLDARNDFAFAQIDHDDRLNLSGSFTLELLIKPDNTSNPSAGGAEDHFIIHKMNNTGGGIFLSSYGLRYNQDTGHFGAIVGFGSGAHQGSLLTGSTAYLEERWYHLAMVYSVDGTDSSLSLFVDGVLEAEESFSDQVIRFGNAPLIIGAGNFANLSGTGQFRRNYIGLIDDVRLSDTDLNPHAFLHTFTAIPAPAPFWFILTAWFIRRIHCGA